MTVRVSTWTLVQKRHTHSYLLSTAVVCLLLERGVIVVEVEFSLDRESMVRVEDVKRERRFWSVEGRGVPFDVQKLAVFLDPSWCLLAVTELDIDMVESINIDHEHSLRCRARRWARRMLMSNIEAVA